MMTKKMIIPAVMVFIAVILIYMMGGSAVAYAAESNLEFDKTYVLDDLEGSAVTVILLIKTCNKITDCMFIYIIPGFWILRIQVVRSR